MGSEMCIRDSSFYNVPENLLEATEDWQLLEIHTPSPSFTVKVFTRLSDLGSYYLLVQTPELSDVINEGTI